MNKILNYKIVLIVLIVFAGFTSCLKENKKEFDVYSDVYTLKKLVENEIVYANVYYVYGNQNMKSAKVTTPDGGTIQLQITAETVFSLSKEPTETDFSTNPPKVGNYQFEVTSADDATIQNNDLLEFDDLMIPVITKSNYEDISQTLEVTWIKVPGADGYVVKMLETDGDYVYLGYTLNGDATSYGITMNVGNWFDTPGFGNTFKLQLHAFKYEAGAAEEEIVYNLQEISIAEKNIIWGD